MDEYKLALYKFCKCYRALIDACDKGCNEEVKTLSTELAKLKKKLINEKEKLGFEDGLIFLEDQNYSGFRIVNGRLVGDEIEAYLTADKYATNFLNGSGAYPNVFYEVATFVFTSVDFMKIQPKLLERKTAVA